MKRKTAAACLLLCVLILAYACRHQAPSPSSAVSPAKALLPPPGDSIVVCGQSFHTGAPVVLWTDAGGYDMYGAGRGYSAVPSHVRMAPLTDPEVEQVKTQGWTMNLLREKVDQFVIHYDVCGTSRTCFKVLHDRGLGVQFMLDIDGTIYQTMDLQEEAWHATDSNGRSVGVEIANMGAYSGSIVPLLEWYGKDEAGKTRITIPARFGDGGVRTANFIGRPARDELISGVIQGSIYRQYDFTPQQYQSLTKLTAALCTVFPKMQCDYPRLKMSLGVPTTQRSGVKDDPTNRFLALAAPGEPGQHIPHALTFEQLDNFQGVLGHYHVQTDKQDPGPALQWDRMINGARAMMSPEALAANARMRGQPARFIPSPPISKPK